MKVVELCGLSRSAGGVFYAASSLCKAMQCQGVEVAAYGKNDPFVKEDCKAWGDISTLTYKAYGPLQSSLELRRMLWVGDPELIHRHGIWTDPQWAALQWQAKTGRPVVISPHGMLDPWAIRNAAWKKKIVGKLFANESLRKATCIHALCRSEVESIRAYGLKNPIALIPNGVELPSLISDHCPPTSGVKRQLLFLGRIHPKKGLSELLKGWAKAKSQNPKSFSNWQLLIAGWDDGNHLAGLKQLASQLDLAALPSALCPQSTDLCPPSSDLCFIGPQYGKEKETLLRSVDGFILPSFSEGLPMSVLEAWSYGLPVVMTDFCNLPAGFGAEAAIRVEPNVGSIFQGLGQLVAMSEKDRCSMGSAGRKLVEQRFTWKGVATDMKAVYEWCMGGGDPPACVVKE